MLLFMCAQAASWTQQQFEVAVCACNSALVRRLLDLSGSGSSILDLATAVKQACTQPPSEGDRWAECGTAVSGQ